MADDGMKVTLVGTATKYPVEWVDELRRVGVCVRLFDCDGRGPKQVFGYARCLTYLSTLRSRGGVLYTHGTTGFARTARRVFGRRVRWVHHHHTDVSEETLGRFRPAAIAALRDADRVIACTAEHRRVIDERFARGGRTVFLPYLKSEGEPAAGIRRVGRPTVIGFFGVVRTSKGVPVLLDAAGWFRENGFVCRLHGPDVEGLLHGPLPDGIEWAGGYRSDAELDRRMHAVDLVVIPSTGAEGLPLVFTEAISRGIPVVAFDGGGLKDVTDFHSGVSVLPPTPEALRRGLLAMRGRLESDPALGRSLAGTYRDTFGNDITRNWWREFMTEGRL
jgi:glycosyltransferase involved in cell wall biosynthesis